MKLVHKALAVLLAASGASFPLVALSAQGNITSTLVGMALGASVFGYEAGSRGYYDVLPSNTYTDLKYDLVRGYNYSMIAACDDDECQDLDLEVYGPDGRSRITSATSNDTKESVFLLARESGTYYFRVIMRGCRLASCEYGVQILYQKK